MMGAVSFVITARSAAQSRPRRVGFIGATEALTRDFQGALLAGLRDLGYREGQNLVVERRYIEGQLDRLPALATELINLGVEVVVVGGERPALAVKAVKPNLPVVMAWSFDPVGAGLAESLGRPGGSVTGLTWDVAVEQIAKRLQIFKETVPSMTRLDLLWDPALAGVAAYVAPVNAASKTLGIQTTWVEVRAAGDLEAVRERVRKNRPGAFFIWDGPALSPQIKLMCDLAIKERLPAFTAGSQYVDQGCLMAYAANSLDLYRRAAAFVDKILNGARPGDLPIEQPTRFELVINLRTAKALGLTIPSSILLRADRVIK
jgi:putative ABC transport system substrate-binding protein